jgi:hypothetical protein
MKKCISILFFMLMMFVSVKANTNRDTVYTYYDAARNKYVLKGNELEYIPVNKKESSSGIYSGGTYESKELTEKECRKLVRLFKDALANKKAQTNKNIKPNAAVEISSENKTINFILIATSAENISISNYLKQLLQIKY